jgi:hypothetical protein
VTAAAAVAGDESGAGGGRRYGVGATALARSGGGRFVRRVPSATRPVPGYPTPRRLDRVGADGSRSRATPAATGPVAGLEAFVVTWAGGATGGNGPLPVAMAAPGAALAGNCARTGVRRRSASRTAAPRPGCGRIQRHRRRGRPPSSVPSGCWRLFSCRRTGVFASRDSGTPERRAGAGKRLRVIRPGRGE